VYALLPERARQAIERRDSARWPPSQRLSKTAASPCAETATHRRTAA
jgi:hypothetical protein